MEIIPEALLRIIETISSTCYGFKIYTKIGQVKNISTNFH